VHQAGGRIFLQLWHKGRISHPSFQPGGGLPVAPSAITWEFAFSARRYSVLAIGNGARCATPPVGSTAAVSIPVIAVLLAFLALRASNCNGWARSWGSGAGMPRGPGKTMYREQVLHGRRKSDPQKVRIAARLRRETTMTLEWLAGSGRQAAPDPGVRGRTFLVDSINSETPAPLCQRHFSRAAERLAHRWRPATSARVSKTLRRAAIRWSARFGDPLFCAFKAKGNHP